MHPAPWMIVVSLFVALLAQGCKDRGGIDPPSAYVVEPTLFPDPTPVTLSSDAIVGVGFLPNGTACAVSSKEIFSSPDGGVTWNASRPAPPSQSIQVLSIDRSGTMYLCADSALERLDPHEINPRSMDIFRSTDAGAHWVKVLSVERPIVNAIVFACNPSGDIIAGYYSSGFAISHNKGDSWTRVTSYWCSGAAASDSRVLFMASTIGTVRRSEDLGATWSTCPGLPGEGLGSYGAMFTTANAETVFVAELSEPGALYRSTNGGNGWTPVWTGYCTNVCRSARGVYYFGTADEVRRSITGGTRWVRAGKAGADITSLAVSDSGVVLAGTERGTVIRWTGE